MEVLDSATESHYLEGGPADWDGGATLLEFDFDIPYDTDYALRFWMDLKSHAEVPEPATLGLLLAGSLISLRRQRRPFFAVSDVADDHCQPQAGATKDRPSLSERWIL